MAGRPPKPTRHWLIQARHDSGMSYKEIAEVIGVTQQAIYYWETGQRTPSPKMAKKMSKVLNIDWTRFYEDKEE